MRIRSVNALSQESLEIATRLLAQYAAFARLKDTQPVTAHAMTLKSVGGATS